MCVSGSHNLSIPSMWGSFKGEYRLEEIGMAMAGVQGSYLETTETVKPFKNFGLNGQSQAPLLERTVVSWHGTAVHEVSKVPSENLLVRHVPKDLSCFSSPHVAYLHFETTEVETRFSAFSCYPFSPSWVKESNLPPLWLTILWDLSFSEAKSTAILIICNATLSVFVLIICNATLSLFVREIPK